MGRALADLVVPRPESAAEVFCHKFISKFGARTSLPFDPYLLRVVLGLRLTGIALCAVQLRDIADCACLRDLVRGEAKDASSTEVTSQAHSWLLDAT